MAFMKKGGKANDSKTAPANLPLDDATPDPNDPKEPAEIKAGEVEPGSVAAANDPFMGFTVKEKVIIPALNNAVGHIKQLTNHAGKPVAEVVLPNGKTDWFSLKEIAAVPADAVPSGGIPVSDPSLGPAMPSAAPPRLSA